MDDLCCDPIDGSSLAFLELSGALQFVGQAQG